MTAPPEQEYLILLIDDEPHNLGLLCNILEHKGVELLTARSGERGIEVAQLNSPDLILLDVMMPGIDGFETCRRLKSNPLTSNIPVIFTTILDDLANKLDGFRAGAVDYLPKPFREEEVVARVGKHIEIHRLQMALEARNAQLEQMNSALESFAHTVAHNLKTPIGQVKSISDTLMEVGFDAPEFKRLAQRFIPLLGKASANLLDSVDALLLLARIEEQQLPDYLKPVDIRVIAEEALEALQPTIEASGARVQLEGYSWPHARAYPPWILEVWKNYITNGIKYGGRPAKLTLGATPDGAYVNYWLQDNGPGLKQEEYAKLFVPFSRLHKSTHDGHGLGLSIVERIMRTHGGDVGVDGDSGEGCRFYFRLPVEAHG